MFLQGGSIQDTSIKMQVLEEEYVGDGVGSSSEETSNDRGAKCWQIVIA